MKCATVRTLALLTACLFNLHCAGAAASKCAAACSAPAPPADAATGPWEDLVKPSASHRIFRQMAGVFDAKSRFWVFPGAKPGGAPSESTARAENKLIFEDRFLVQDYRVPGRSLVGVGYYGFDNLRQTYQHVWLDSAITGIETLEGSPDATAGVVVFRAEEIDPVTRKKIAVREVLRVENDDRYSVERYEGGADGAEVKSMETVYTRVK
jgi:hypothetical protein